MERRNGRRRGAMEGKKTKLREAEAKMGESRVDEKNERKREKIGRESRS